MLARPRLWARLDEASPGALVLVSAAPGYGKTTLVADWLAHAAPRQQHLWLTMSEDAEPTAILEAGDRGVRLHRPRASN